MAKDLAVAPVERVPAIRPDYLLVADSIPALIGVIAPDGAVEGVNRSVLDYFGDIPWRDFGALKLWYMRIKSRPSFRAVLADRWPGLAPSSYYDDLDF